MLPLDRDAFSPSLLTRLTLALLLLGLAWTIASPAQAQHPTAVTSILNGESTPDTTLEVNHNGSLLAPGTVITDGTENDSIPAEGAGTRMMWYPAKAAFRAGRVGFASGKGDVWDADSIGKYSVAFGRDTYAPGYIATALGNQTTASGSNATAMNFGTTASAGEATAMGYRTTAATSNSLTIGILNDKNRGNDDVDPSTGPLFVVGNGSLNNRSDALVLDQSGNLEVTGSFVLPDGTILDGSEDVGIPPNSNGASEASNDDGLVATGTFGSGSIPKTGSGPRMMWYPNQAAFRAGRVGVSSGKGDVWDADSIGDHSVAFGRDTRADGRFAVAMGDGTIASSAAATALGNHTTAEVPYSTALGNHTVAASNYASVSIGVCNDANRSFDSTLLVAGNGSFSSGSCSRSDALVLQKDGDMTIAGTLTESSDRRLKKDINALGSVIGPLKEIRPVRFRFEDESTHPAGEQIGLVAQDVRKEFPSLVSKGSGGYLSLAYPKLTAVLLKGLQEQQATIEKQQSQIAHLQAENEAIKERLAALEAKISGDDPALASLAGPWTLALLLGLGLGGVGAGLFYHRRE